MTDEAALLAAILAHPDEDTPRLMYADWLDEHGQPERAEFVRIRCDPTADEATEDRAAELEERNRAKWLAGLPQFGEARWEFCRGFPEHLEANGELFLERYDAFARVPWLRSLWLHVLSPWDLRDFANRDWQPQWVELALMMVGFSGPPLRNGPAFVELAKCSQLAQIRRLTFDSSDLDAECLSALAASPHLENLEQIWLLSHRGGEEELALSADQFAPLRERFGERLVIG